MKVLVQSWAQLCFLGSICQCLHRPWSRSFLERILCCQDCLTASCKSSCVSASIEWPAGKLCTEFLSSRVDWRVWWRALLSQSHRQICCLPCGYGQMLHCRWCFQPSPCQTNDGSVPMYFYGWLWLVVLQLLIFQLNLGQKSTNFDQQPGCPVSFPVSNWLFLLPHHQLTLWMFLRSLN